MQFIGEHTTSNAVPGIVSVDFAQWRCHFFLLIAIHFQLLHSTVGSLGNGELDIVIRLKMKLFLLGQYCRLSSKLSGVWHFEYALFFRRDQASWLDRKRKARYQDVVQVTEGLSRQTEDLCRIMVVLCKRRLGLDNTFREETLWGRDEGKNFLYCLPLGGATTTV